MMWLVERKIKDMRIAAERMTKLEKLCLAAKAESNSELAWYEDPEGPAYELLLSFAGELKESAGGATFGKCPACGKSDCVEIQWRCVPVPERKLVFRCACTNCWSHGKLADTPEKALENWNTAEKEYEALKKDKKKLRQRAKEAIEYDEWFS